MKKTIVATMLAIAFLVCGCKSDKTTPDTAEQQPSIEANTPQLPQQKPWWVL